MKSIVKKTNPKNRRRYVCLGVCLSLFVWLCGCSLQKTEEAEFYLYYLNQSMTGLESVAFDAEDVADDTTALIDAFLAVIEETSERVEYQRLYPDTVHVERYEISDGCLSLYFNEAYNEMEVVREVLCREALVVTFLQLDEIEGLSFYVAGEPLCDANGVVVGLLTEESFLDNPSKEINDIQETDLTLYFASLDGTSLVSETQHVYYYSSNISQEKLVMERLLIGPKSENARSALPENTGLVSVSVLDGVCVVNLDEYFLTQNYDIQENVVIYSIVNSLAELSTVDTVQISVNGETNLIYRQEMSLAEFYSMNVELIMEEGESVEVDQEEDAEKEGLLENIGE